jgi:uncharacterized protein
MRFSPAALLSRLRRDKAQDPFGGDDDDAGGESGFALSGPQLALGVSGLLFVLLIGGVATVIMTSEAPDTPPPMMGSFADLEVVEEDELAASPDAAPTTTVATTDRSASRRPWLNPTAPASEAAPRSGASQTAQAPAEPAGQTRTAAVPASSPSAPSAGETGGTARQIAAESRPATETNVNTAPTELAAAETPDSSEEIAALNRPSLADAGPAPGAPGLFDVLEADSAADTAGGRPRLVEPTLPPIDRQAVAAPPPRYANLSSVQNDASRGGASTSDAKIAIVVEGLGLSEAATEAAILKLPSTVTLAFSPYARNLKKWMDMAKEHGHEVLIEVPMESKRFPAQDPGPLGLLTSLDEKELTDRLETILKDAEGAVGVLDTMGSQYRESDQHISAVFAKLSEENLYYVQGRPGVRVGETTVPTAIADVLVDERPFRAAIDARLDYLERLAKYQGSAVAAVGAKPVSFERLVLWMEQTADKGVVLSPVSQVLIR